VLAEEVLRAAPGGNALQKNSGSAMAAQPPLPTPSPRFCGRWSEYGASRQNRQDYRGQWPL